MLVAIILSSVPVLWLLYVIGIQYERKGWWSLVLPVTFVALLLDVVMNYTVLAVVTMDWPRAGEHTFSVRLSRLARGDGWRYRLAIWIKRVLLDPFDPDGVHIR